MVLEELWLTLIEPTNVPIVGLVFSFLFFGGLMLLSKMIKKKFEEYIEYERDNVVENTREFLGSVIQGGLATTAISIGISYYFLNLIFSIKLQPGTLAGDIASLAFVGNIFVILADITAVATFIAGTLLITAGHPKRDEHKSIPDLLWIILFLLILSITLVSLYTFTVINRIAAI
jgi:hypothetical protein